MTQAPTLKLRASSAPRWGHCYASHQMEAHFPEEDDTEEAREGTAGHFYGTEAIEGRVWPEGHITPNGYPITAEMIRGGNLWVDDVRRELAARAGNRMITGVERKVYMRRTVHPDNEGSPDTFLLDFTTNETILWDYKFGHYFVDPFANLQVVDYVAGVWESAGLAYADTVNMRVSIRIVQPRNYDVAGSVRRWDTDGVAIWELIARLRQAAALATGPNPPFVPGVPQCRDCRARHACEANKRLVGEKMHIAAQATPVELPPDVLGRELHYLIEAEALIRARRVGLEEDALARISKGQRVPGWTKGRSDTKRAWRVSAAQVIATGEMLGVDLRVNKPVTVAEAERLGVDAAVITAYSHKPLGSLQLMPVDEKAALKAFGKPGTAK